MVDVSTRLDAPADAVWNAVRTPGAFRLVTRGLLRMPAIRHRVEPWRPGETVSGWIWLLGVIPFSRHTIHVARIDHASRTASTEEHGGLLRRWNHDIEVTPIDDHSCHYRDRIDIDAGVLTPVVAAWAGVFYRIRQRRWRELAPVLTTAGSTPPTG